MVIVKGSQKIEVNLEIVEYVGVDTDEPDQVDKVPKSSPNGKSPLKVCVSCKVYLEVDDNEYNGNNDQNHRCQPES